MAAGNNIVGEVGLKVVPIDAGFQTSVRKIINEVEAGASFKIAPKIDNSQVESSIGNLTKSAQVAADQASNALQMQANLDTSQFTTAANQIQAEAEAVGRNASNSFAGIAVGVGVAAAAMYGLKAAGDAVVNALSGLFDNLLKAKAGFEAILGAEVGNKLLLDIQEFARVTPFATEQLVQYSQQLLGVGRASESIIPTLRSVGDLVASKGGDTQTISRVLFTLTQIQSVGRLIGQDAMQLQSALIPITKLLADSMGKTQAEVKALQAAGKITADQVFNTLEEAGLDVAGAMEGATRNIGGAKEALSDTITILQQKSPFLIKLNQDIVDAIKNLTTFLGSERINELVTELSEGVEDLYVALQPLAGQLSSISSEIILTFLEALTPLIAALGGSLGAIPLPVLTALGTFFAFNKFQTFVQGFGKVSGLLTNFGGVLGGVAGGLSRTTQALSVESSAAQRAAAQQQALVRTYSQIAAAAGVATGQTNAYTAALVKQTAVSQAAAAAAFKAPPQVPGVGLPAAAAGPGRLGRLAAGARKYSGAGVGALGAAGFLGMSLGDEVEGNAGSAVRVASTAATGAALGAQIGGPWGAAIGAGAGLGFGIFKEINKKARDEAEADAEKWGEIGRKSAEEFTANFAKNFNVETGSATQTEKIVAQSQTLADVATLRSASQTGIIGAAEKAAAGRLGIDLGVTEKPFKVTADSEAEARARLPEEFRNAALVGSDSASVADRAFAGISNTRGLNALANPIADATGLGQGQSFEFAITQSDIDNLKTQSEQFNSVFDDANAAIATKRKITNDLLNNPLSTEFFGDEAAFVGPRTVAELDALAGKAYDRLQSFSITEEQAVKLGEKLAFYFSDVLDNIQGSVDQSFKWNAALEETSAVLETLNKERLKEAGSRIGALAEEEGLTKKILALRVDGATESKDVGQLAVDALKNAATQAALEGGTAEEAALKQNELFATSLIDVREQLQLTEPEFRSYLEAVGLYDDYLAATDDQTKGLKAIEAEILLLQNVLANGSAYNTTYTATRLAELEAEKLALQGIVTEETKAQQARDQRNAQALGIIKAGEAIQGTYGSLSLSALDGAVTLGQFGDAASQAFNTAAVAGATAAEDNQLFVDSIENIQLALGYSNEELNKYLESVGLLDAYNKALASSSVGLDGTVTSLAEQYGLSTEAVRGLLGLIEEFPNDLTFYVNVETQAAFAALAEVDAEITRLEGAAGDQSASGVERAAASRALGGAQGRRVEILDTIAATGADANAGPGARQREEDERKRKADEEAAKIAEKAAKDALEAAEKAAQEADKYRQSVESAANTLQNAIEQSAEAMQSAAEAFTSSIKERVQYEQSVSVGRLIGNTDRQTSDLTELNAGIDNLKSRGVSDEVLEALGIDNVADLRQVRKLVKANDSDLGALTQSVSKRDAAALDIAKSQEDKRTRDNIQMAIIAAATELGIDMTKESAAGVSNQFNITPGLNAEDIALQILGILSGGKIAR